MSIFTFPGTVKFTPFPIKSTSCVAGVVGKLLLSALLVGSSASAIAGVKVAFTGDQGHDDNARAVLNMIANEGTDLLLIQGDLGYDPNAHDSWESNLNSALGSNFPVLSVVGNHENYDWPEYHRLINSRIDRAGELSCSGNPGVKAHCKFRNIEIVQVSPGITEVDGVKPEDNYDGYIKDSFSGQSDKWRICSWHKNQKDLQTGNKGNSTGWDEYRACLNAGAIVAVAHEHAYSRTHLLSSFENRTVVHRNSDMTIEPGRSFMFVSGLGGKSIREQSRGGDWWASIYTASQGATHGALFCDFESQTARCYCKAINGSVIDEFTLRLNSGTTGSNVDVNTILSDSGQNTENSQTSATTQSSISIPSVFERTDVEEFRWIDRNENGDVGNVWISPACADTLGGTEYSGTWDDLVAHAPAIDSITSPCNNSVQAAESQNTSSQNLNVANGYVFERTDKNEFRWIANTPRGAVGSVRIDSICAQSLGGAKASGDWFRLMEIAPEMDALADPCGDQRRASFAAASTAAAAPAQSALAQGYVFERTDKDELRWVAPTASGELGSVRINKVCGSNLGGQTVKGDWFRLLELAPKVDQAEHPCDIEDQPKQSVSVGNGTSGSAASGGYVYKRTDIDEYRWIATNDDGKMGSIWIDRDCARSLGDATAYGDWFELQRVAPAFDSLRNPCN